MCEEIVENSRRKNKTIKGCGLLLHSTPPPPPGGGRGGGNKLTNTEQHEFYSVGTGPKTEDVFSVAARDRTGCVWGSDRHYCTVLSQDVKERTQLEL
jgi:hypothetical protein